VKAGAKLMEERASGNIGALQVARQYRMVWRDGMQLALKKDHANPHSVTSQYTETFIKNTVCGHSSYAWDLSEFQCSARALHWNLNTRWFKYDQD
jgi:hypothetical protein